ncbi:MAG: SurA N-terminal domain-containing protein [Gammaproteobacteria bacterium]|nr:SurA N-terminal domain-containing protein [Gammaproteobacteria bacterium]
MLQSIRDRLHGPLAYVVLGPIVVVFVAWGAYGLINQGVGASSYAAEANGEKISLEEARNAWLHQQARFGGQELPAELRTQLQDSTLEGLIENRLLDKRTQDLGYRVGPEQLRVAVQEIPAFQINGQYSAEAARVALQQAGLNEETFEAELRDDVRRLQLEGGIRASNFLTPTELARLGQLQDEEREARYFTLPAEHFASAVKVDEAAVADFYKNHQSQFMTPESDRLQYAELRLESLAAGEEVSEADLHAAYEKNRSRLEIAERRHARQILITAKDDAAALAQAQQVLAEARSGKDFAALARQYSKDPGSAKNGGDLGWVERSNFAAVAPELADALFGMSVGEIKGPVKTKYGYHILRLEEVQAGGGKSFEQARPDLEAQLRRDRATDRFGEIQEQLQTRLAQPGADLGALAQEFHLQQGEIDSFQKGPGGAPLGPAVPLQQLLFGDAPVGAGKIAGPVLLGDDRLLIVKVLEHRAPAAKPLPSVHDAIVAALTREQETHAALQAAQAASAELEGGASFESVAAKLHVSAEPAHFVGRQDPSLAAPVREAVFAMPRPSGRTLYRAVPLGDGAAVVALSAVRSPPQQNAQAQAERGSQQAQRDADEDVSAYVSALRRNADVRKNPKAFE